MTEMGSFNGTNESHMRTGILALDVRGGKVSSKMAVDGEDADAS